MNEMITHNINLNLTWYQEPKVGKNPLHPRPRTEKQTDEKPINRSTNRRRTDQQIEEKKKKPKPKP